MEIRKKITFQFVAIFALFLLISSLAIYISFSQSRKEEFFDRLKSKAKLVAQMLIDIDEIDAELLRKIEKNNPLSLPDERIIIFDSENNKIYSTDEENKLKLSNTIVNIAREQGEIRLEQQPYEIVGNYYQGQSDKILVFVAAKDIFGLDKLNKLGLILIIVFLTNLFAVYFAGKLFSNKALLPISDILNKVDHIEASKLNIRLDEGNGKDEISSLAQTFNKMLQRLESAFAVQKSFISNASHELRTPLTVMSGNLEVLLLKNRQPEEYKTTLNAIFEEIKSLINLSNKLLLLAQTSSELNENSYSNLRIDESLWQSRQEILNRNIGYEVQIEFDENIDSENNLIIKGNQLLLKTAFMNIIDNACKYSENKKVCITLEPSNNNSLNIKFRDNGIGIPADELNHIFEPFYRAKNALNYKGHGIGLSLVEKIIKLHHGKLTIESTQNSGTSIILELPVYSSIASA